MTTDLFHLVQSIKQNDWNYINANTQYLTHAIHRYSGKFIPQIARHAIQLLTSPGDIILDPYCGSGTTILEASLRNRQCIGLDINPLAALIAKVKTTPVDPKRLANFVAKLESYIKPILNQYKQPSLFDSPAPVSIIDLVNNAEQDERWKDDWYKKWFSKQNLLELIIIHQYISKIPDINCRNIGLVVFSDILRKCSNANSSYPNVMFDKRKAKITPAAPSFAKRLREITNSISKLWDAFEESPNAVIINADACTIPLNNSTVDAIITHPPYIASIPYAEYGSLSLTWLGHNPRELDKQLTGGRRSSKYVVDRFQVGFQNLISESWRVLKPNKFLFFLLGNPTVRGNKIDLSKMAIELATDIGFLEVVTTTRAGKNRRANLMGQESLIFLQKRD